MAAEAKYFSWSSVIVLMFCLNLSLELSSITESCSTDPDEVECLGLIPPDYKKSLPSNGKGFVVDVVIRFTILDLDEINEESMDMRLHGYLTMVWNDDRLIGNHTLYNSKCSRHIWVPDLNFETAKTTQTFGKQNSILVIQNQSIAAQERYAFKTGCPMNFQNYPFDKQFCQFTIAFGHEEFASLRWIEPHEGRHPVEVVGRIEPLQFHFLTPKAGSHIVSFGSKKANFTYMHINLTLVRRLMGSIINIYLPSTLIVAASWITFWVRLQAAPARVSLSITSLLTLCTQVKDNKNQLPPLNYITAVDIWCFVCIFMVFSTLVEFAVCYNSFTEQKIRQVGIEDFNTPSENSEIKVNNWTSKDSQDEKVPPENAKLNFKHNVSNISTVLEPHKIDLICRKLFPLMFLAFSVAYWGYYWNLYFSLRREEN